MKQDRLELFVKEFVSGFKEYMKGIGVDVREVDDWWIKGRYRFRWGYKDVEIERCYCDKYTFRLYIYYGDRYGAISYEAKLTVDAWPEPHTIYHIDVDGGNRYDVNDVVLFAMLFDVIHRYVLSLMEKVWA